MILSVVKVLQDGQPVSAESFKKVRMQLMMMDGMLYRFVKLPIHEVVTVPVNQDILQTDALRAAHVNSDHGAWDVRYDMTRSRCYFPNIALALSTACG